MYGLLLDEIELGNLPNSCKGFRFSGNTIEFDVKTRL